MKRLVAIVTLVAILTISAAAVAGPIYPGGIFVLSIKEGTVQPNGPIYPPGLFSEMPAIPNGPIYPPGIF